MGVSDIASKLLPMVAGSMFGNGNKPPTKSATGSSDEDESFGEKAAKVVGQGDGGIGSMAGSTVGGIVGSVFGPAGTAIGSAVGGQAGSALEKSAQVPAGPGATIESGKVDLSKQDFGHAAMSMAQSMQHLALQGFRQKTASSGEGKVF